MNVSFTQTLKIILVEIKAGRTWSESDYLENLEHEIVRWHASQYMQFCNIF